MRYVRKSMYLRKSSTHTSVQYIFCVLKHVKMDTVVTNLCVFYYKIPSDCVEYEISSQNHFRGTCESIIGAGATNHTLLSCQSLCLDTYGCRGSTFWTETGICDLHECDSVTKSNDTHFTGRTCLGNEDLQFIFISLQLSL